MGDGERRGCRPRAGRGAAKSRGSSALSWLPCSRPPPPPAGWEVHRARARPHPAHLAEHVGGLEMREEGRDGEGWCVSRVVREREGAAGGEIGKKRTAFGFCSPPPLQKNGPRRRQPWTRRRRSPGRPHRPAGPGRRGAGRTVSVWGGGGRGGGGGEQGQKNWRAPHPLRGRPAQRGRPRLPPNARAGPASKPATAHAGRGRQVRDHRAWGLARVNGPPGPAGGRPPPKGSQGQAPCRREGRGPHPDKKLWSPIGAAPRAGRPGAAISAHAQRAGRRVG
jgi:hypothetical protein